MPMTIPSKSIIALAAASALCLAGLFLLPALTIDNFPVIEGLAFILSTGFLALGILSVILAAIHWRRFPAYARTIAVLPLGSCLLLALVLLAGTPRISAEVRYAGAKERVIVDFVHGHGASGFAIPNGGTHRDDDTGRATLNYHIDVSEDYGADAHLSLTIDMTKEVPRLGRDRHLVVDINDHAIAYRVLKR
jgi:hypothetical protein